MKGKIGKYLLDLLIVAFGVFLGMVVSDWNTQRKTKGQVEKTKQYIIDELKTNIHNLEYAIKYHTQLRVEFDSIASTMNDEDRLANYYRNKKFRYNKIPSWTGPGITLLDKSVYEGAKMGNFLQEFDIKTLQLIARTYRHQDGYEVLGKKMLDKLFSIDFDTKTIEVMSFMELLIFDILPSEEHLKTHLEETIKKLNDDSM